MNCFILVNFTVTKTKYLSLERRKNKGKTLFLSLLFVISCSHIIYSQNIKFLPKAKKLHVIRTVEDYKMSIKIDPNNLMVSLDKIDTHIVIDLRYGTANNFTKQILYKKAKAFLRLPVAKALMEINKKLLLSGYALKIYDAYRPYSVTQKMWEVVQDHHFVANPAKGSGHNRGASVDLTLIKLDTGKELPMGTDFDNFTIKAGHFYTHFPKEILDNRQLLKNVMQQYGFEYLKTEWWHYIYRSSQKFELMDLEFDKLE